MDFERLDIVFRFSNGNCGYVRLTTDLLLKSLGQERFSWGGGNLIDANATRAQFVAALRATDGNDYGLLKGFMRWYSKNPHPVRDDFQNFHFDFAENNPFGSF